MVHNILHISKALGFCLCASLLLTRCEAVSKVGTEGAPIKVGVVLSLSGERSTYGKDCLKGINMALDFANGMGGIKGRKVELVVRDDSSSVVKTMQATQSLSRNASVMAVLGGTGSKLALAGASIAQELRIAFMTPLATNTNVTDIGTYISRICFSDSYQGPALADYSFKFLKLKSAGIIFNPEDEYSLGLATSFKRHYMEIGGRVLLEIFQSSAETDSAVIMKAIMDKKPDAIYMPGYHAEAANLTVLLKKSGANVALLGSDGWESPEFLEKTSPILTDTDRIYITTHFSPDDNHPLVQRFVADYRSRYGELPTAPAALGYDAAGVLCEALRRTPQLERHAISESINSISDFEGVTGNITIDEKRNAVKDVVILKAYGGRFIFETTTRIR